MQSTDMKMICLILFLFAATPANGQRYELQRLMLDIQKLAQLKTILTDLYKGYEILNNGYTIIRRISAGNFNLHQAFLDGLLLVSPAVRNYPYVADIISQETSIVAETKAACRRMRQDGHFKPEEIRYLSTLYNNLLQESLANVSRLVKLLTASILRMSDQERLQSIDALYAQSNEQYIFLKQFVNSMALLSLQRSAGLQDAQYTRLLYGLP